VLVWWYQSPWRRWKIDGHNNTRPGPAWNNSRKNQLNAYMKRNNEDCNHWKKHWECQDNRFMTDYKYIMPSPTQCLKTPQCSLCCMGLLQWDFYKLDDCNSYQTNNVTIQHTHIHLSLSLSSAVMFHYEVNQYICAALYTQYAMVWHRLMRNQTVLPICLSTNGMSHTCL